MWFVFFIIFNGVFISVVQCDFFNDLFRYHFRYFHFYVIIFVNEFSIFLLSAIFNIVIVNVSHPGIVTSKQAKNIEDLLDGFTKQRHVYLFLPLSL